MAGPTVLTPTPLDDTARLYARVSELERQLRQEQSGSGHVPTQISEGGTTVVGQVQVVNDASVAVRPGSPALSLQIPDNGAFVSYLVNLRASTNAPAGTTSGRVTLQTNALPDVVIAAADIGSIGVPGWSSAPGSDINVLSAQGGWSTFWFNPGIVGTNVCTFTLAFGGAAGYTTSFFNMKLWGRIEG